MRGGARWIVVVTAAVGLVGLVWAAFTPVQEPARAAVFEIPQGTWARRMSGDPVEILPEQIRLTLGIENVLELRNLDEVPQIFGPTLMMPGQSFRLPFAQAGTYDFACTAHASGQMRIIVDPFPATPWTRLKWRLRESLWGQSQVPESSTLALDSDPKAPIKNETKPTSH